MKVGITERGDASLLFHEARRMAETLGVDGAILITKNPVQLKELLDEKGFPCPVIVHCTITGFGGTRLEPWVMRWQDCMTAVESGDVLRIDPIIPTERGIETAMEVLNAAPEGVRVRISFIDMYPHVKKRFVTARIKVPYNTLHAPLEWRMEALQRIQAVTSTKIEICGEPGMDCTGCISQLDLTQMGLSGELSGRKNQRGACTCSAQKVELLNQRQQCAHQCAYCYWR